LRFRAKAEADNFLESASNHPEYLTHPQGTIMTEQNNSAGDKAKRSAGAKPKKPTSAYRKVRRVFAKTRLRRALIWLQHRGLEPTDVFYAAYPKSGSTWARFVLYEVLCGKPAGFKKISSLMTTVARKSEASRLLPGGGRLFATHEDYQKEYRKAIYVTRDPRDIVLAEYAYYTALDYYHDNLDHFIESFVLTKNCSVYGYGPWQRHISTWLDSPIADTNNMLLLRFEDLRKDPVPAFARVVKFLGMDVDLDKIRRAVENNTVQKMREKEDRHPGRAAIRGRFVREGAVRGWVSKLTPAQVRLIEKHAGPAMVRMGYPFLSELNLGSPHLPVATEQFSDTGVHV
jgi:Sulfotransferase domain